VQYGVAPGWQLSISVPFAFAATQEEAGSRNLRLRAFYQFVQERRAWPAVAASARAELPTGLRSAGVDTRVKFLATKTLGPPPTQDQLHLNVAWLHNAGGHRAEREHYYSLVAGYSRVLNLRSLLLLDYAREQEQERDITTDIFEIGVRRLVGQHIVLGVGIGAGLDATSPPVRFSVAVQYGF